MKKSMLQVFVLIVAIVWMLSSYLGFPPGDKLHRGQDSTLTYPSTQSGRPGGDIQSYDPGQLTVHFIDVGQADSILVQTPEGKNMLIDAGSNKTGRDVVSYLKNTGIEYLDVVIGTHPHEDHIGGLDIVIDTFDIGKIYMPRVSHNTETFKDVIISIKNKGLKISPAYTGTKIDLDPKLDVSVLAPVSEEYQELNNYSVVVKLKYENTSFLFTGDAEYISEKEMLERKLELKANVLKIGHHGSKTSTSPEFLEAVKPDYAVISVGKDNDYGHPSGEVLKMLEENGIEVLRTDLSGTIIIKSDGKSLKKISG